MVSPADYRRRSALSWRVRAYVAVLALRNVGFAYAFLEDEGAIERSRTFRYLFEVAPPRTWAFAFGFVGIAALGGLLWPREKGIRFLVVLSVGLSSAWAAGTLLGEILDPPTSSSIAAVAFVAFALKDLLVAGMVYVNPIEKLVEAVREEELESEGRRRRRRPPS